MNNKIPYKFYWKVFSAINTLLGNVASCVSLHTVSCNIPYNNKVGKNTRGLLKKYQMILIKITIR